MLTKGMDKQRCNSRIENNCLLQSYAEALTGSYNTIWKHDYASHTLWFYRMMNLLSKHVVYMEEFKYFCYFRYHVFLAYDYHYVQYWQLSCGVLLVVQSSRSTVEQYKKT